MLTRIPDEKIEDITNEYEEILGLTSDPVRFYIADALLDAQLESDQEKVKEIFEEIERYFKYLKDQNPPILITDFFETKVWWQDFKERWEK